MLPFKLFDSCLLKYLKLTLQVIERQSELKFKEKGKKKKKFVQHLIPEHIPLAIGRDLSQFVSMNYIRRVEISFRRSEGGKKKLFFFFRVLRKSRSSVI